MELAVTAVSSTQASITALSIITVDSMYPIIHGLKAFKDQSYP